MSAANEGISVLVADDHADSLSALAMLLRMSGYTVYAARTLSEATAMASARRCDLLVGDIQFSDGSGLDLMRDLHVRYGLRGIAVTGFTTAQDVEAALKAGFARHLAKPITFPDLLAAMEELTGRRATERLVEDGMSPQDGAVPVPMG